VSNDLRRLWLEKQFGAEADLQSELMKVLKDLGFEFRYHTHRSDHSEEGFPDIAAINRRAGILWVAELKGLKTKTTEAQRRWLEAFGDVRRLIVRPEPVRAADYDAVVDQLVAAVQGAR